MTLRRGPLAPKLALTLTLALWTGLVPVPWGGPARADVAEDAAKASADLSLAVDALNAATESKDRVAALTQTIRAYESGLAAMRSALRQVQLRQESLERDLRAKRAEVGQLIGALSGLESEPGPLLLIHPGGPLGTVRSGMIMADVAPALQAQADTLKASLGELSRLQAVQLAAADTLQIGMADAQAARTALSQAISDRTDLPTRFIDDPASLEKLLASAQTLGAFAKGLKPDAEAPSGFADQKGRLSWPVLGRPVLNPGEPDAKGVKRPGVTLATRPLAIVTAPWAATVRYVGPLLDYGNVMILEPGDGYLLVVAGMEQVYAPTGAVVGQGAALGLMGGTDAADQDLATFEGAGAAASETLYLELRKGAKPVDPTEWFGPSQG